MGPILFDTGYAEHFHVATTPFPERLYRWTTPVYLPQSQTLRSQLARFDLAPDDIRLCVISHFHGDHIAGLRDLTAARFIVMRAAHADLEKRGRVSSLLHGLLPVLLPGTFTERVRFAESYDTVPLSSPWTALGPGFDLIGDRSILGVALPGHAAGHMGLIVRDAIDREVLLAADASWSIQAIQKNQLPSLLVRPLIHDWAGYGRILGQLHELTLRHPELVILPSHCETSLANYQTDWGAQ